MQTLTFEPVSPFVIGNHSRFHIVIVGAGGTGSFVLQTVARLMVHCQHSSINILTSIVDGDVIEPKNIGRQLFAPAEIGRNKALALATRFNQSFGLKIHAVPAMLNRSMGNHLHRGTWRDQRPYTIVIGAVDNALARQAIHESLEAKFDLWIDGGNHEHGGQVLIGSKQSIRSVEGCCSLGSLCDVLPSPALVAPELIKVPAEPQQTDCADAMANNRQSLLINQQMATIIGQYLNQLIFTGRITTYETIVDLTSLTMRSTSITPSNLAKSLNKKPEFFATKGSVKP